MEQSSERSIGVPLLIIKLKITINSNNIYNY